MHFLWHSFNISHYLIDEVGPDWESQLIQFALQNVNVIKLSPTNTTSREDDATHELQNAVVDGTKIRKSAPWLFDLYRTKFRDFAELATQKRAICAKEDVYAINLNVQIGNRMRYECHVDSNPIQGMLYVTSHPVGQGGDLVVNPLGAHIRSFICGQGLTTARFQPGWPLHSRQKFPAWRFSRARRPRPAVASGARPVCRSGSPAG